MEMTELTNSTMIRSGGTPILITTNNSYVFVVIISCTPDATPY